MCSLVVYKVVAINNMLCSTTYFKYDFGYYNISYQLSLYLKVKGDCFTVF